MHFNYKLRQPAETRSSAHNIPVTERYIYLGQAGEKQGKGKKERTEEMVRFDSIHKIKGLKQRKRKLTSTYDSLGLS